MAALWTKFTAESAGASPYEFGSVVAAGSNTFTPSTSQHQAGSYSYCAHGANGDAYGEMTYTGQDEVYTRFYLYIPSTARSGSTWSYIMAAMLTDGDGAMLIDLQIETDGSSAPLRWACVTAGWGSSSTNFSTNAWHKIEFYWKYAAGANTQYYIKVDDSTIFSSNTITAAASTSTAMRFGCVNYADYLVGDLYYDEGEGHDAVPSAGGDLALSGQAATITNSLSSVFERILKLTSTAQSITSAVSSIQSLIKLTASSNSTTSASSDIKMKLLLSGLSNTTTASTSLLDAYLSMIGLSQTLTGASGSFDGAAIYLQGISASDTGTTSDLELYLKLISISNTVSDAVSAMGAVMSINGIAETTTGGESILDIYRNMVAVAGSITSAVGSLSSAGDANLSGVVASVTYAVGVMTTAGFTIASRIYGEVLSQYMKGAMPKQDITGEAGNQYMKGKIN